MGEPIYNLKAEEAVIGCLLLNNLCYEKITDFFRPFHLYTPGLRKLYETISSTIEKDRRADIIALKSSLEADPDISALGGVQYLACLISDAKPLQVRDFAQAVYEAYLRRELVEIADEVQHYAKTGQFDKPPLWVIDNAEQKLFEIVGARSPDPFVSLAQPLSRWREYPRGVLTGLRDLDHLLGGLQKSQLIVIAGRPSMGKTSLAVHIGRSAAKLYQETDGKEGACSLYFSLEMSSSQLAIRILSQLSGVSPSQIAKGRLSEDEASKLKLAATEIEAMPFFVDDYARMTIPELRTRARRKISQLGKNTIIVIDYLQIMHGIEKRSKEDRVLEVNEITRGLKSLARELDVPVIAISQVNRAVEARESKRPILSDLYWSASIEQDADVVLLLSREGYYHMIQEPAQMASETAEHFTERYLAWADRCQHVRHLAEVSVAKHRHGPTGHIRLRYEEEKTLFSDA